MEPFLLTIDIKKALNKALVPVRKLPPPHCDIRSPPPPIHVKIFNGFTLSLLSFPFKANVNKRPSYHFSLKVPNNE